MKLHLIGNLAFFTPKLRRVTHCTNSIFFLILSACAASPRVSYEIIETGRPDGSYGSWMTKEVVDAFGSYTFSTAHGEVVSSSSPFIMGAKPRIVIQDDFNIRIHTGDAFICGNQGNGVFLDYILKKEGLPEDKGERSYWKVSQNNSHLELHPRNLHASDRWRIAAWINAFNQYDTAHFRYKDSCGEQRVLEFDIRGETHVDVKQVQESDTQ